MRKDGEVLGSIRRNEIVTSPTGSAPHFFHDLSGGVEGETVYTVALLDRNGREGLEVGVVLDEGGGDTTGVASVALLWSCLALSTLLVSFGCAFVSRRLYGQGVMHLKNVSIQSRRADRSGHQVFERLSLENLAAGGGREEGIQCVEREIGKE